MTAHEASAYELKITEFRRLEKRAGEIQRAIQQITRDDPKGPCGQGPFTSNTRESRQVHRLQIAFSVTRGGAPPTEIAMPDIGIEAYEFGECLKRMLEAKLMGVRAEMSQL